MQVGCADLMHGGENCCSLKRQLQQGLEQLWSQISGFPMGLSRTHLHHLNLGTFSSHLAL